ncbi:COP1-interacting protein 7 [Mucuna pruriens]|uniref:COP1-interacting protein 7 n=1 Tax=Mucuna pruriens TaxID=157652 RepID=A0A371HCN5_MUCPR|nr:COP1-interacting protein 7 [Mucuna pruriens]
MKSDTLLDYAVFQLSPRRSRCELLVVSSDGNTEKLASGLVKPFLTHLKVAEEQVTLAASSIKLEIDRHKNAETWFTKGTFERFVWFVSTPEVLEKVNTYDAEMSQLEAARRIYSQGAGEQRSDPQGGNGAGAIAVADATTKELLRAIDVRLSAVRQDLSNSCGRASASGFNPHTVSQLKHFADRFGANRLNEACTKYMSLYERRPDLISHWPGGDDRELRSSVSSDMSIDNDDGPNQAQAQYTDPPKPKPSAAFASLRRSNTSVNTKDETNDTPTKEDTESPASASAAATAPASRRLSVQDRINLFENKQKENSSGKPPELRRLSSDVLRRWSGASDMSIDVSGGDKRDSESPLSSVSLTRSVAVVSEEDKDRSDRSDKVVKTDQGSSQETGKVSVFDEDKNGGFKDQVGGAGVSEAALKKGSSEVVGPMLSSGDDDVKFYGGVKNHVVAPSLIRGPRSHSRSLSAQFEGGNGLKLRDFPVRVDQSSQNVEVEDSSSFSTKEEDSQIPKMKYQKPSMAQGKRDETRNANEMNKLKQVLETQDNARATSTPPLEQQHQRVRQSKGNQGLHDELKMKADELEKLFAEHKLRVPGDQSGSAKRVELADAHVEQSQYRRAGVGESTPQLPSRSNVIEVAVSSSNLPSFDAKSVTKTVDSHNYGDALRQSFSDINLSEDSRGKFYEKYMKKRNAKLREDWSVNRAEKEARMKAMQDSLERSRAEMKANFSGSANRQDSASGAHRAEKLKYFKSNIKREQHPIDSLQNEDDEDLSEFSEEKTYGASRQSRKNFPNRHVSSGTPRTTAVSVSRSSGRRRDNPLAQSVPNFSDLRKENTKPSSGVSKTTRPQVRTYTRSKSTTEDMQGVKEEKSRQTQSLRKSSANPAEFKDFSPLNSDGIVLSPLKFDMDETDLGPYDQSPRSFLKKGNNIGSGSVGNAIRMKASVASDTQKNKEFDDLEFDEEDSFHMAVEEQDDIETMAIKDVAYSNNGKASLSQESGKSGNSGSEIGDSTRSLAQVDPISVGEMAPGFPSTFNGVRSLQDSPVGSPVSWNSRMPHPFSYPHESSDIDASMDSPIGSPASWNSHSLNQGDNDAARMRKKWGSAQKPFLVANSSQNQPRKDVTKGFKRLLKFGRKTRGSESLADWISATTSEGDDDTEDGRDLANRSSEDLRKSRMGFSHGHPSDDSFNESDLFNEQVQSLQSSIPAPPAHFKLRDDHISGSSLKAPKSFFSLSTFRSKGSDSKPR